MGIVEYHCKISKRAAKKAILKQLESKVWDYETGSSSSSLWSSSDMGEGHRPWNEAGSDVTCVRIIVSSGLCASWLTPTPEWQCNMLGSRIWSPRNKTERSQLLAVKCSVKITEISLSVRPFLHAFHSTVFKIFSTAVTYLALSGGRCLSSTRKI